MSLSIVDVPITSSLCYLTLDDSAAHYTDCVVSCVTDDERIIVLFTKILQSIECVIIFAKEVNVFINVYQQDCAKTTRPIFTEFGGKKIIT